MSSSRLLPSSSFNAFQRPHGEVGAGLESVGAGRSVASPVARFYVFATFATPSATHHHLSLRRRRHTNSSRKCSKAMRFLPFAGKNGRIGLRRLTRRWKLIASKRAQASFGGDRALDAPSVERKRTGAFCCLGRATLSSRGPPKRPRTGLHRRALCALSSRGSQACSQALDASPASLCRRCARRAS